MQLSTDDLLTIHQRIIDKLGGTSGLRDPGMLQAIVSKPNASFGGDELYPDIPAKAAALYEAVINYHVFIDGNKRTSVIALGLYLEQNGFDLTATNDEIEKYTIRVATSQPNLADVAIWIRNHIKPHKDRN